MKNKIGKFINLIISSFLVNVPLISSFVDEKSEPVIFLKNSFSEWVLLLFQM